VDDDFDDGYGDPSDYGMTQADFDTATSIGQAVPSQVMKIIIAQAIANSIAQPQSWTEQIQRNRHIKLRS
jgi:hypothetical protein